MVKSETSLDDKLDPLTYNATKSVLVQSYQQTSKSNQIALFNLNEGFKQRTSLKTCSFNVVLLCY